MASDNEPVVAKKTKRGNPLSTFLVLAAVVAAGGMGRFLWKYQASLDHETPSPAAAAPAPPPTPGDAIESADTGVMRAIHELQSPAVQPAPRPPAAPPGSQTAVAVTGTGKSQRGGITIVGKNGTTSAVAPAPDLPDHTEFSSSPADPARPDSRAGPRIYTSKDPNRDPSPAPAGPGKPRYYNYDLKGSYTAPDTAFQNRTTYKDPGGIAR